MSLGFLVLESGEVYSGKWEAGSARAGEVVFNTSHSGYEEIATDPSYFSQIVVMTAPMQGNYGVDKSSWESRQPWIEGFVCLHLQKSPRENSWQKRLHEFGIPCLSQADTRAITLRLRQGGTPWGALVAAATESEAVSKAMMLIQQKKKIDKDWVYAVSVRSVEKRKGQNGNGPRVAVLDFGSKENILRELQQRCSEIIIFPSRSSVKDILACQPQALMLTNGPGDPADIQMAASTVRELIQKLPIFGICMGHQILGLALGAKTYKMKFGHRGSNHPIKDTLLQRVYVTSQNHGYAVDGSTLPADATITHWNLNDMTVAGFYSEQKNYLGIQYHPESHPGPHEAAQLFDFFVDKMIGGSV